MNQRICFVYSEFNVKCLVQNIYEGDIKMCKYYCTMCSIEYCYQALVLYNSLDRHDKDFKLFIACLDNKMVQFLDNLHYSNLIPIDVCDIEKAYKELSEVKQLRNKREYAWTLKPSIVLYIFENFDYADHVLWLDSDMQFLCSPEPLYEEWGTSSLLLSEQYYTDAYEYLVSGYGKYQAGFIGFRKDKNGMECLRWWQERCMEWCSDKADNGRWADQKYLDELPERFEGVGVVNNFGINLTPFIVYRINTEQGKAVIKKPDGLYIDNVKIILYHYYGLRFYEHNEYDLSCYWMMFDEETIKLVYMPYIKECQEAIRKIQDYDTLHFKLKSIGGDQVLNYYNLDRTLGLQSYDICIITGKSDLIKCMALYYSIAQNSRKAHIWICCIDEFSFSILNNAKLENVTLISSRSFETSELHALRKTCGEKEYICILKAHYLYYILKNNFSVNYLMYVGNDIYFYKSPLYLLKEFENGSIFLYRLPKTNEKNNSSYKTDLIGFRRDKNTLECLISWKDRSVGWHLEKTSTIEHLENDYINAWPSYVSGVRVLENKFVNTEPKATIYYRIVSIGDRLRYIKQILILLNFYGFRTDYNSVINDECLDDIYKNQPINEKLQKKHKESVKRAVLAIKKFEGSIDNQ